MASTKDGDRERLFLLDAMALAYRAHFALIGRPLINSRGLDTSAIFGFTSSLLKLLEDEHPEHIAVVFDSMEEKTFRDTLFEQYKANRAPMPEPLQMGIPYIKEMVRAFDIPVIEIPGVEADDVIGTLARRAEKEDVRTIIVSPDKDFQQLLSPHICVMRPAYRGEQFDLVTDESFREKYGVEPHQFIDILALLGDTSDNVPGVPGIGKKTAPTLIREYGSIENLLDLAEEITAKRVREGLLANREEALLSKRLVTILTDVELNIDWHDLRRTVPHEKDLYRLAQELEFQTLLNRIRRQIDLVKDGDKVPAGDGMPEQAAITFEEDVELAALDMEAVEYRTIKSAAALDEVVSELEGCTVISIDTETTDTDPMLAGLVGLSLSWRSHQAVYIPVPLPDGTGTEAVLDKLKPILSDAAVTKVGQNLKYDIIMLGRHGIEVRGALFDTLIAHYLIEPEEPHNLDAIARKYLHYKCIPISDLIGTGRGQLSMRDVPLDKIGNYACEDAEIAFRLSDVLCSKLDEDGLRAVAEEIEFPLIRVLVDVERTGVKVDREILREISVHLTAEMARLEEEVYRAAGREFNIGSTKQLGEVLFGDLKLKVVRKTGTGKASTNERVLLELATEHELPGLILDWRSVAKLKSTYVDALGELINPETGRVHTNFNQTVTATGRLSSSSPNLQNIPVRTAAGREIRRAFVAEEGFHFVTADYAQIELRIIASMSGDEGMKEAFSTGRDIHTDAAARIFGVQPEDVTRDMRRKAKEVNYGIPYGVSPFGLAQRLRVPVPEARALIDQYHRSYPALSRFLHALVEDARQKGYVETLKGRRRYVPDIRSRNRTQRSFAERVAMNMPIQGTQADMTKLAMVRIHDRIDSEALKSRMILQVHDELVFEVPPGELDRMKEIIHREMVAAIPLEIPIEVDIGVGDDWFDAH